MAFCIYCGIELPQAARFCFKCGKAVSEIDQELPWHIPGGENVPLRDAQQTANREKIRLARSLVTIDEDVAALIVYGNANMQGTNVMLMIKHDANPHVQLRSEALHANIVGREVQEKNSTLLFSHVSPSSRTREIKRISRMHDVTYQVYRNLYTGN